MAATTLLESKSYLGAIDVGNESHFAAVPPDRDANPVQEFGCWTADLKRMAEWLKACRIDTVAMQATGVYSIPLYDILTAHGIQVVLVNAQHSKNVPGRKSDDTLSTPFGRAVRATVKPLRTNTAMGRLLWARADARGANRFMGRQFT